MLDAMDICCAPMCGIRREHERMHHIGRRKLTTERGRRHSHASSRTYRHSTIAHTGPDHTRGSRSLSVNTHRQTIDAGFKGTAQWLQNGRLAAGSAVLGQKPLSGRHRYSHSPRRQHRYPHGGSRSISPRISDVRGFPQSNTTSRANSISTAKKEKSPFFPTHSLPSTRDVPIVVSPMPPKSLQGDPAYAMDANMVNQIQKDLVQHGISQDGIPLRQSMNFPLGSVDVRNNFVSGFTSMAQAGTHMLANASLSNFKQSPLQPSVSPSSLAQHPYPFHSSSAVGTGPQDLQPGSRPGSVFPYQTTLGDGTYTTEQRSVYRSLSPDGKSFSFPVASSPPVIHTGVSTHLSSQFPHQTTLGDGTYTTEQRTVHRSLSPDGKSFSYPVPPAPGLLPTTSHAELHGRTASTTIRSISPEPHTVTVDAHGTYISKSPIMQYGTQSTNMAEVMHSRQLSGYSSIAGTDGRLRRHESRVLDISQLTELHQIIGEKITEREVVVPKKRVMEEIIEREIVVPERRIVEEVVEETQIAREKIIEVAKPVIQEKIVEYNEVVVHEKLVEHPEIYYKEKIVEVPVIQFEERIVEIPKIVHQEKIVEFIEPEIREVTVEKIVEKIVEVEEVKILERPVPRYVDKPVPEYVTKEEFVEIERRVPIPVDHLKIFEFKLPRIRAKYIRVPLPVYCPRFIEVAVPSELLTGSQIAECQGILDEISSLALESSQRAISLLEIEALGSNVKQMNPKLEMQLSGTALPRAAIAHHWATKGYSVTGYPSDLSEASTTARTMASLVASVDHRQMSTSTHPAASAGSLCTSPLRMTTAPYDAVHRQYSLFEPHSVNRHITYDGFDALKVKLGADGTAAQGVSHPLQQAMATIRSSYGEQTAANVLKILSGFSSTNVERTAITTHRDRPFAETNVERTLRTSRDGHYAETLSSTGDSYSERTSPARTYSSSSTSRRKSIDVPHASVLSSESVSSRKIIAETRPTQPFVAESRVVSYLEKQSSSSFSVPETKSSTVYSHTRSAGPAPSCEDSPHAVGGQDLQHFLRALGKNE